MTPRETISTPDQTDRPDPAAGECVSVALICRRKEPKPGHCEAYTHQTKPRPYPGKERTFSCKVDARVLFRTIHHAPIVGDDFDRRAADAPPIPSSKNRG